MMYPSPTILPPAPDTEVALPPRCEIAQEPNTTVNLGAFLDTSRDDGFPARTDEPTPLLPIVLTARPKRRATTATTGLQILAGLVACGGAFVTVAASRYGIALPFAAARSASTSVEQETAPAVPAVPCVAGGTRVLVRGVRLAPGVEAGVLDGRPAAAVSPSSREARAVAIDDATLDVLATAHLVTTHAVRRALPLLSEDSALDVEDDEGTSFVAPGGLLTLREMHADAVRSARLADGVDAVVFRRGASVWGMTMSGSRTLDGPVRLSLDGEQVGSPSVATTRAGDVIAAWAARSSASDAWRVHFTRWTPGTEPETPRTWPTPGMAPSVAARPGGGMFLAWTEGASGSHVVRATALGDDGAPRGNVLDLSAAGANAGQERVVLSPDGRGAAFFLERQDDGRFALVARGLTCRN